MPERKPPKTVSLTLELSPEVAEFLAEHGKDVIAALSTVIANAGRLKRNWETEQAEYRIDNEKRQLERQTFLRRIGRNGYRLVRQRLDAFAYFNSQGVQRNSTGLTSRQWRKLILDDISDEFGVPLNTLDYAVSRFRKELHATVKIRRDRSIIRQFKAGVSLKIIAGRVKLHPKSINRIIRNRDLTRKLPGTSKELKNNDKGDFPGKSQTPGVVIDWNAIKRAGGPE